MRAGMHRNTARRHLERGQVPSERLEGRTYRTRPDPFAADWADLEARLAAAPGLEAKTLFEDLRARRPAAYADGHLRTLQRRVKAWRASRGPEREVFFAQEHRPGEASQTDFTYANELGITIRGEPYPHQLCHFMLPYSNWGWATPCRSESMAALFEGMQEGLWRLGGGGRCQGPACEDHSQFGQGGPPFAPRSAQQRSINPTTSSCSATQAKAPTSPIARSPTVRVAPRSTVGGSSARPSTT